MAWKQRVLRMNSCNAQIWEHVRGLVPRELHIRPKKGGCTFCMSLVYTYPLGYHGINPKDDEYVFSAVLPRMSLPRELHGGRYQHWLGRRY